ncbi:MAG TPA: UDP-N-acetylmuramate dehydrogenase [Dehalococcoidia bacterium]|nr:UDP-N-acetylmuramate dehydrogenase [Dehalococcoidia bacterium]
MGAVNKELLEDLRRAGEVRLDVPLSRHTTFGIGGPADVFVIAQTADDLRHLVALCHRFQESFFILGAGSNILVSDKGIRGVTIENRARGLDGPVDPSNGTAIFRAESGASIAALARYLSRKGLSGLEWAGGIPGTIGGAVVYNAGAYDGSMAAVLKSVQMVSKDGLQYEMAVDELGLGYRESAFTRRLFDGHVILSADLLLKPADPDELAQRLVELDRSRQASQPRGRSAGSIFKNTREYPAWWLIDQVGLRGHRHGDAEISAKHPNFILNTGHATAKDVMALIDLVHERVEAEFAVKLVPEVAFVGEDLQ